MIAPKIIPVLDLMNGEVVHGVAGERDLYRPVVSELVEGADPLDISSAFKERFGFKEIYIADLDAIRKQGTNLEYVQRIVELTDLDVILDYGLRSIEGFEKLIRAGVEHVVVATESMESLEAIGKAIEEYPDSVMGSLDLKEGNVLSENANIRNMKAVSVAEELESLGLKRLIVLELSLVGTGRGPIHEALVDTCSTTGLSIIAGGGVRTLLCFS
ncbi:MAG: HisA/HisF-related TIM barrel protein [Candidatus Thorarchaeota archaeon]|jgi:phosphoribosylformimino-5-aminoimidazole carboxamide ribotide isomerase